MIDETMPQHGFLFADSKGPWSTERLTKVLTRETGARLGFRMTVQEYRHIAIAIDRKFIRGTSAEMDEDEEDEDDIHDLMAAHSTKLADARYARMGGLTRSLTPESISIFRTISDRWQRWYKLESRRSQERSTGTAMKTEGIIEDEVGAEREMKGALQKMYGQSAEFKTEQQKEAVLKTVMGVNQLFIILPTGQGKSLTFMIPAMLQVARTTVVITPLVALAQDMCQRCRAADIDTIIYGTHKVRQATIVIIVTESAVTASGMQFITDIHLAGRLDRIVFDECHKLFQDRNFRPKLVGLKNICMAMQLLFLTATFPPSMLEQYKDAMVLKDPQFIRIAGHKLRTRYNIKCLESNMFKKLVGEELERALVKCEGTEKVLVFCRSRNDCEAWARRWECDYYHSEATGKSEILQRWTSGLLFATGSLGAGVDIMNIRTILHLGIPYGMIEFDQEVGRGGRSGELVESLVLLSEEEMTKVRSARVEVLSRDDSAIYEYLRTEECRRSGMSRYLNGEEYDGDCESLLGELCDNCVESLGNTVVGKRRIIEDEGNVRRVKRRLDYQRRENEVKEASMEEERRVQHTMDVVEYLQDICSICWLRDGVEVDEHEGKNCPDLKRVLGMKYSEFRGQHMRFESYSCCFRCGLPQELCGNVERGNCDRIDVIFPVVVMSWFCRRQVGLDLTLELLGDGRDFTNVEEYIQWVMKSEICFGRKGHNGFKVFEGIVRDRVI